VEVVYLYGAYPPELLRTHLVEAEGVPVDDISELVREYRFSVDGGSSPLIFTCSGLAAIYLPTVSPSPLTAEAPR
jgi:hypothetical protein